MHACIRRDRRRYIAMEGIIEGWKVKKKERTRTELSFIHLKNDEENQEGSDRMKDRKEEERRTERTIRNADDTQCHHTSLQSIRPK